MYFVDGPGVIPLGVRLITHDLFLKDPTPLEEDFQVRRLHPLFLVSHLERLKRIPC